MKLNGRSVRATFSYILIITSMHQRYWKIGVNSIYRSWKIIPNVIWQHLYLVSRYLGQMLSWLRLMSRRRVLLTQIRDELFWSASTYGANFTVRLMQCWWEEMLPRHHYSTPKHWLHGCPSFQESWNGLARPARSPTQSIVLCNRTGNRWAPGRSLWRLTSPKVQDVVAKYMQGDTTKFHCALHSSLCPLWLKGWSFFIGSSLGGPLAT